MGCASAPASAASERRSASLTTAELLTSGGGGAGAEGRGKAPRTTAQHGVRMVEVKGEDRATIEVRRAAELVHATYTGTCIVLYVIILKCLLECGFLLKVTQQSFVMKGSTRVL